MEYYVIVYGYNPQTGEYTGEAQAWEDPLTPGEFLDPANSTRIAPPAYQDGKIRVWNGSAWTYQDAPAPSPEPGPPTEEQLAAEARYQRNQMLAASDWTQLPDVPIEVNNKNAWAVYRQALRNLPQQAEFPTTISWPSPPPYVKA